MKTLLEFLTMHVLPWCMVVTVTVGFYFNWMYRRHWLSDPSPEPRPGDPPLAVFRRTLSNETRAYRRKAAIALLLLAALMALEIIGAYAVRSMTAPGG
jgi:hypothetical protein